MSAAELLWSLQRVVVGVDSNDQLPGWIMTSVSVLTLPFTIVLSLGGMTGGFDIVCVLMCTRVRAAVVSARSKEAKRLCPQGVRRSHLSLHARGPTHLHRRLMTPAC